MRQADLRAQPSQGGNRRLRKGQDVRVEYGVWDEKVGQMKLVCILRVSSCYKLLNIYNIINSRVVQLCIFSSCHCFGKCNENNRREKEFCGHENGNEYIAIVAMNKIELSRVFRLNTKRNVHFITYFSRAF